MSSGRSFFDGRLQTYRPLTQDWEPIFYKNIEYAPRQPKEPPNGPRAFKETPKASKWTPKGNQMEPKGDQMDPKGCH